MDAGFDGDAWGAEIADMVRCYVDKQLAPLVTINAELASANEALATRVAELEAREIPEPLKGEPGEPGQPGEVDMEMVVSLVKEAVAVAVAELPPAEKGDPGEVDMEEVKRLVVAEVKAGFAALPVPEPGKDGTGLAGALIDSDGNLALTLSNGEIRTLGRVVGKDGEKGKDGKDGETFSLDDFDIVPLDDPRDFKFCFTHGEVMHSFELSLPGFVDKGVWREGEVYREGDGVSWGGQMWLAERSTPTKPDTENCGWRLAVKRGRDGKDKA